MARRCSICARDCGPAVARERARGLSFDAIAAKFDNLFSGDAVRRHMQHCVAITTQPHSHAEVLPAAEQSPQQQLLAEVKRYRKIVENLQGASYSRADVRGAIAASKVVQGWIELEAKLLGIIQTGSRSLTLVSNNIDVIDEATAVKMARIYLERHQSSSMEGECTPKS